MYGAYRDPVRRAPKAVPARAPARGERSARSSGLPRRLADVLDHLARGLLPLRGCPRCGLELLDEGHRVLHDVLLRARVLLALVLDRLADFLPVLLQALVDLREPGVQLLEALLQIGTVLHTLLRAHDLLSLDALPELEEARGELLPEGCLLLVPLLVDVRTEAACRLLDGVGVLVESFEVRGELPPPGLLPGRQVAVELAAEVLQAAEVGVRMVV